MENVTNKANDFIKGEVLKLERNWFIIRIIAIAIGYSAITFWLNAIRATAPLWFVWILIIVQFALYFLIFIASYKRAIVCSLDKNLGIIIFTVLAILGRVNDWELVIIPLTVVVMIVLSKKTKNVSDRGKTLLPEHSNKGN